jgi:hypothetical protein
MVSSTAHANCAITFDQPGSSQFLSVELRGNFAANVQGGIIVTANYSTTAAPPTTCPVTPTGNFRAARAGTSACIATLTLSRAVASNASDNGSPILPARGAPAPDPLQVVITGPNLPLSGTVDVGDIKLASVPDFKSAPQATSSSEIDLTLNGLA